jgi:hypothetical protein
VRLLLDAGRRRQTLKAAILAAQLQGSGIRAGPRRRCAAAAGTGGAEVNAKACFRAQPRGTVHIHGYVQQVRLLGRGDKFSADRENDVTA